MKTLNEIREERQANVARVAELSEKIDKAVNSWRTKDPFPEDFTALGAELATATKRARRSNLERIRILSLPTKILYKRSRRKLSSFTTTANTSRIRRQGLPN